jgi:hypothetical protein
MAAIKNAKTIGAEFPNATLIHRAIYDYSVDAGAIGALDVFVASQDVTILEAYVKVLTTCTSGGAATLAIGIDADPDTLVDETAIGALTAGALIAPIAAVCPVKLASGAKIKMNIADFTLTAGKFEVVVKIAKF